MSTNGDTALPPLAGPSLSWAFSSDSKSTDEGGAPTAATTAVPATASGLPPPRPPTPSERTESEMELAIATGAGREQMPSPHLDAIADHVYLSNHDSATNRELLEAHGITHILTVGIDMDQPFAEENIIYETIVEYDDEGTDLFKHFDHCFKFIDSADQSGGKCLVHCRNGVSRSATIVSAYMYVRPRNGRSRSVAVWLSGCRSDGLPLGLSLMCRVALWLALLLCSDTLRFGGCLAFLSLLTLLVPLSSSLISLSLSFFTLSLLFPGCSPSDGTLRPR